MDHQIWVKVPLIHDRRHSNWPLMTRKSNKTRWNDERDRFSSIIYQLEEFKVLICFKVFINKCHAGHFNTFASTLNGDSRVKFIHDWFLGYLGLEWGSLTPELFNSCILGEHSCRNFMNVKSWILSDHFSVGSCLWRHIEEDVIITAVFFLEKFQVVWNIIGSLFMLKMQFQHFQMVLFFCEPYWHWL